jgi:predicted PurR-regulated permease PerM
MTLTASPQAREASLRSWRALGARLQTVSPRSLALGLLMLASLVIPAWIAVISWPALLPFAAGVALAYAVLPIANRLDRYMPRVLAALIAEGIAVAVLLGAAIIVLPPLVTSTVDVVSRLPTGNDAQAAVAQLEGQFGSLPEPLRGISLAVLTEVVTNLQATLRGIVDGLGDFLTTQILGILDTVSFVLGLFVIPVWILTVVADEHKIKRHAAGLVTPALRADAAALVRIADRALSTFLRVRVTIGLASAIFVWIGLVVARELGLGEFRFAAAGATLLGLLQLIPELGFFLGFFPLVLVFVIAGPVPALTAAVVYVIAVRAASTLLETRLSRGVLDVHPGILIPAIVAMSQLGLIWLLIAAPVLAIARDTVRYLAGRLGDPPKPANVIPGEGASRAAMAAATIPSVYRHRASGPRLAVASTLPPTAPGVAVAGIAAAQAATRRTPQP